VKPQPVLEVAARFPVLEQDEGGNTQHGNDVLQKYIHGDTEHLPLQKSAEHVHHDGQSEDDEQIFKLQIQERDLRRQVSGMQALLTHISATTAKAFSIGPTSPHSSQHWSRKPGAARTVGSFFRVDPLLLIQWHTHNAFATHALSNALEKEVLEFGKCRKRPSHGLYPLA
jgi:hypothetical protein